MKGDSMQTLAEAALHGGLYTVPQAARILGAPQSKVRSWLEGYANSEASPILRPLILRPEKGLVLSFLDLIESAWVHHFLDLGYSPQTVRKVADKLRERTDLKHPFASKSRFLADGKSIFEESIDEEGEARLLNLMNDNFTMGPIVQQSLFDRIFYVQDVAAQFQPLAAAPEILMNPKVANGRPAVKGAWVPTETLFQAYIAEDGDAGIVADDYRVTLSQVNEAVAFERALRERALH
jgi:uncharacterized protein (DUF433 family)